MPACGAQSGKFRNQPFFSHPLETYRDLVTGARVLAGEHNPDAKMVMMDTITARKGHGAFLGRSLVKIGIRRREALVRNVRRRSTNHLGGKAADSGGRRNRCRSAEG